MKKILVIAAGFPPAKTYGGPAVSVENFCNLMKEHFELYVITSNHELHSDTVLEGIHEGWNNHQSCKVLYLKESLFLYKKFKKTVKEIEPDYIYINSFFSAHFVLPTLCIAKTCKIPVILAPRGQFANGALKIKNMKKSAYRTVFRFIKGNYPITYQATSKEEYVQIEKKVVKKNDSIIMVANVPTVIDGQSFRQRKNTGMLRAVYIARIHPIKNLKFALNCLKECKERIVFNVYGPIEDKDYWEECQTVVKELPDNVQFFYKGSLPHSKVKEVLSLHDVFLLPTETENFGHSIVEAMLAKCVPIISDNTPWINLQEYGCGWAISLEKKESFTYVLDLVAKESEEAFLKRQEAIKDYLDAHLNITELQQKYISLFSKNI